MTQPKTEWELGSSWTTTSGEENFLKEVSDQTDLRLTSAGRSVQDRDIWRVEVGNSSGNTILAVASQHGNEPAGREAALIWARDLAYSNDSIVLDFLARHRVVVIPNANPDGLASRTRLNANGVDLNRGWATLSEPEHKVIRSVSLDVEPSLLLDLHEWGQSGDYIFAYFGGGTADYPAHPELLPLTNSLVDFTVNALESRNITTRPYPGHSDVARSFLSSSAVPWHSVGYLTETRAGASPNSRVNAQKSFLEQTMVWYLSNESEVESAREKSIQDSMDGVSETLIPAINANGSLGPWTSINAPDYYEIPDRFEVPEEILTINGIEFEGRRVSTNQRYRGLIPTLLDSRSHSRVSFREIRSDDNDKDYGVVKHRGIRYPIKSIVVKQNHMRHVATGLVAKQNGVRYPNV